MDKKINFTILLNKKSSVPLYIQLYEYIKNEIVNNNFKTGSKLPSIREVSSLLKISKTTIENTYNQLILEGYIESMPKRGFFINEIGDFRYSKDFTLDIDKQKEEEHYYVNNGVDPNSFDINIWKKLYNKVLLDEMTDIFTGGTLQGEYELRYEVSQFVNNLRGGKTLAEQVVIGAGIQYLIGILAGMLREKHDKVAIETPGYKKAEYIFEDYNFDITHLDVKERSLNIEELINSEAKLLYTSPSHQYPLGDVMPINKRTELLNWANSHGGLIIEDDYDGIIRYDGMPIPCLQGLDVNDRVIYLGSFSKTLLPSLRISFMIIPRNLIDLYKQIEYKYTQSTSKIDQTVLASFIKDGYMTKHLRKIRKIYKKKNHAITDYLTNKYGEIVDIINSASGFHLVLSIKTKNSIEKILKKCKKNNILIEIINHDCEKVLISVNYSGVEDSNIEKFINELMQSI